MKNKLNKPLSSELLILLAETINLPITPEVKLYFLSSKKQSSLKATRMALSGKMTTLTLIEQKLNDCHDAYQLACISFDSKNHKTAVLRLALNHVRDPSTKDDLTNALWRVLRDEWSVKRASEDLNITELTLTKYLNSYHDIKNHMKRQLPHFKGISE